MNTFANSIIEINQNEEEELYLAFSDIEDLTINQINILTTALASNTSINKIIFSEFNLRNIGAIKLADMLPTSPTEK